MPGADFGIEHRGLGQIIFETESPEEVVGQNLAPSLRIIGVGVRHARHGRADSDLTAPIFLVEALVVEIQGGAQRPVVVIARGTEDIDSVELVIKRDIAAAGRSVYSTSTLVRQTSVAGKRVS